MSTPTLATRVRERAASNPAKIALRDKHLGVWRQTTWQAYWEAIEEVAHGLLALEVQPGDRVAIQSENRPEWLILDMAVVAVRGVTVGLYPTNPEAEVQYLLSHSGAKVLIAEDQEQLDKALTVRAECPDLTTLVYCEPRGISGRYTEPELMSFEDLRATGREHREANPGAVTQRMEAAEDSDVVTLVYTSGTTGPPKGAMLNNANVNAAMDILVDSGGILDPPASEDDLIVSYLPLCHVAERFFTTWQNAGAGVQVNFAESIDTISSDLREIQPTLVFGVPRIWEKLLAGARIRLDSASRGKRSWSNFWLNQASAIGATLAANGGNHTGSSRVRYAIGWLLFYRALQERLGLRHARHALSGAAPIAPEVLEFFMGIGVPMHEVYGMTENAAVATANRPGNVKLGTVGQAHDNIEVMLDPETGEVLTRHGAVFAGYWDDEAATASAIDADGWLHTGDVGEWDGEHLRITDRMKDLIITAGGKNIAPSEIENKLKASPFIKEAVVIGDRRKYLTALIGIELDTVGAWAQRKGIGFTTYRDLSDKAEVRSLVEGIVKDVNDQHNPVEQLKDFAMLPKELDHEDGELTATQKIKRSAIDEMFGDLIEQMYAGGAR